MGSSGPVSSCRRNVATYLVGDKELQKLPGYLALTEQDKEILWTAALLHDEKRSTTTSLRKMSITAKGHARKGGEYTVRTLLYKDISTPFIIREKIASLVGFTGLPCG